MVLPAVIVFYDPSKPQMVIPAEICEHLLQLEPDERFINLFHNNDNGQFINIDFINNEYVLAFGWNQFVQRNRFDFGDHFVFEPLNDLEWRFFCIPDHPTFGLKNLEAAVKFPTLSYLPLRTDQVFRFFHNPAHEVIVHVLTVDGASWDLPIFNLNNGASTFGLGAAWIEVAKHVNLMQNDHIVLRHLNDNTFRCYVFDIKGIERINFDPLLVYYGPPLSDQIDFMDILFGDDEPEVFPAPDEPVQVVDDDVEDMDQDELDDEQNNFLEVVVSNRLVSDITV
ncbi:uncharacterized protein LOC143544945 [Bidens hawaiensis]|uniref:uncharacterized protein LOC143544945 n=1 Tax=Bidens hawaiensis TaxID=980011 RepID=UPI00404A739A